MIKKLILVFIGVLTIQSYAQQRGTASPYSFYGIGSLKFKSTVENRSMGGLSVYVDSIHVNLRNPASYATENIQLLRNESRPVKYTIGGSYSSIGLQTETNKDNASTTSLDYLALSLPLGKFGVGFGLVPYTSVGYKLETLNGQGDKESRFTGKGGVNRVFLSAAYLIKKGLSIGVDANYNFGNIENANILYLYDDDGIPLFNQTRENNRSNLSGLSFNFGLSYRGMISEKLQFVSGITYSPQTDLTSKNERSLSTIAISSSTEQEFVNNTVDIDLGALGLDETDLIMPSKFSIGAGIGAPRKWFVGAEYTSLKTSNFSNALYDTSATTYEDSYSFSVGGFFVPDYTSYTSSVSSYLKRVTYRGGLRFEKTGLNINNESINEFGISFGLGLPLGASNTNNISGLLSNINFGCEIGKRGTTNNNLIKENFINFQISLSLNDRWFEKSKYN
ncbi:hypothetical protein KO566_03135 [Flavobacteriaceae bacterium XHP0103]|uniref:hypothetical protein n=1 Tax=Marixanthotalea marina TaxID=2844359 RepID=UPI002989CFBC|nr:hypothetical protein [Marixanthotalea marina]MBU3821042.1 hypothetical protein [Marixanthotalea marina]